MSDGTNCRVDALIAYGRDRLGVDESARADLRMLVGTLSGVDAARQLAFPETEIPAGTCAAVRHAIERRAAGEPVAYILGYRDFWRHRFRVTPATLIPRPETEQLVEWALELLPEWPAAIADLGTGSGVIALSLAADRPDCRVLGIDMSPAALTVAEGNRRALALDNVLLLQGNWATALRPEGFDLVVSNPPYIRQGDAHLDKGDLRFEPQSALVAGWDGLDDYRQLIPQAFEVLKPGGWLLLEHGYDQAEDLAVLMAGAGFETVSMLRDYGGQPRNTAGRKPSGVMA